MEFQNVVSLLSGIALFLFGMTLMGDGLKKVAGNRLELILFRLSDTPLKGLLLGTGVTAAIQSSCATSVMAVGFVNAGMMKVRQSIHVILGAILGTSVTGWVICLGYIEGAGALKSLLSTATLTGVVAVIGNLLRMFTKNRLRQHIGDILLGFAVLMFGMRFMSEAVSPLSEEAWFLSMLTSLSNPLLGILAGTDPVAIDRACLDLIYAAKDDPGQAHFLKRVESRHGVHTIEAAADLGFGSREYELVEI